MTRPLTPRLRTPWRPRPWVPLLALAVVALGILASASLGLQRPVSGRGSHLAPVAAASHSVQMANFAFAPQVLTVTVGDSITWTNQDEAPHTVTTTSAPQGISSPMLSKGQSFTFTFTVPGTYSYYCTVHPDMRARVVVKSAPAAPTTLSPSAKPSSSSSPSGAHSVAVLPAHPTTPSAVHSHHEVALSAPTASTPASSASSAAPAMSPAPAPPASAPLSTDAAAAPAVPGGGQSSLNPTLVLAGITAGATVFCLLLVASRRADEH